MRVYCVICWLIMFGLCALPVQDLAAKEADITRYYQAVAVLQSINKGAALESEEIPRGIYRLDETESLIHHADEQFVYQVVADELVQLQSVSPKVKLFEAHARLALGQKETATKLLMDYVAESEVADDRHYGMIVENLSDLKDWISLYIICLEWEEKKDICMENRALFEWEALTKLGRHEAALRSLARSEDCLGWKFPVYEAMSLYKQGKKQYAQTALRNAQKKYPDQAGQITNLWYKVAPSEGQSLLGE